MWELQPDKSITELVISPSDFGLPEHPLAAVKGGDAKYNSATMRALLSGELSGPVLDFVLLNSAALLFVAGKASSLVAAVDLARISISSGKAKEALERFSKTTLS